MAKTEKSNKAWEILEAQAKPLTLQLAEKMRTIREQYNTASGLPDKKGGCVVSDVKKLRSCLPLLEDAILLASKIENTEQIILLLIQLREKTINHLATPNSNTVNFFWGETKGICIELGEFQRIANSLEVKGRLEQAQENQQLAENTLSRVKTVLPLNIKKWLLWHWKLYEVMKTIFRIIPYWIYIFTLFLAALLTCLYYLGCLEQIKVFIYKLFAHK